MLLLHVPYSVCIRSLINEEVINLIVRTALSNEILTIYAFVIRKRLTFSFYSQQGYWSQFDEEDPEALMEIITRLGHTMIRNPELEK